VDLVIEKLLLGRTYPEVHWLKDNPSKWMGSKHRKALHDLPSNLLVAVIEYPRDPARAFLSAQLHDLLDFGLTKAKAGGRRKKKGERRT
jgi:hypothetical protein